MKKRLDFNKIPDSYKVKVLGSGNNGTCYETSDGKVYKEFFTRGIDDEITRSLLDLKCEGFAFPEQLVYVNGILKGFLRSDNYKGVTLADLDHTTTNIGEFNDALRDFEEQIKWLSYEKEMCIYALHLKDLIYTDDKKIVDIDTDSMYPFEKLSVNPYFENIKELGLELSSIFMNGEFKSKRLQQLQKEIIYSGCMRPSVFISEALEMMDKYIDVNTIKDYEIGLSLLRK